MSALVIDTVQRLEILVKIIFEHAITEPLYVVAYANMCRVLTDAVSPLILFIGD